MSGKKVIAGCVIAGLAILFAGAASEPWDDGKNAVLVEEVYVVQNGDTIWDIAETYCARNTATRRYILEYKAGMEELNPWLMERKGEIYPGDKIKVTYWVKGEEEQE